jgi:hypothetical protein
MDEAHIATAARARLLARIRASNLFRRDTPIANYKGAIGWWESRRVAYNLVVGIAGMFSGFLALFTAVAASTLLSVDFGIPNPPGFAIIVVVLYAIMANVCYTGGWIAEIFIRKLWPHDADRFATTSFFLGLAFFGFLDADPRHSRGSRWFIRPDASHFACRPGLTAAARKDPTFRHRHTASAKSA